MMLTEDHKLEKWEEYLSVYRKKRNFNVEEWTRRKK